MVEDRRRNSWHRGRGRGLNADRFLLYRLSILGLLAGLLSLGPVGCQDKKSTSKSPEHEAVKVQSPKLDPPQHPGSTLFLAQAQFVAKKGKDGKSHQVPGPARLEIYTRTGSGWQQEQVEDPDSNVFHKAAWVHPVKGAPGILTIGAQKAMLKLWRKTDKGWQAERLWNPTFGPKFDRLRDFEVGDVTGNGNDDIVIATHDQGVVAVLSWKAGKYQAEEISREKDTFVHEIELGDVDGDGTLEILDTPSHPNRLDGTVQTGAVDMWKWKAGKWTHVRVDTFKTRHAKEWLTARLPGETRDALFASMEGERIGARDQDGDSTRLRMYHFDGENIVHRDIASLPGKLCRFLTYGETDGDGRKELIAFTSKSGIWKMEPPADSDGTWKKSLLATGSSGFEHAAYLYDFNGDGKDEIYVASDNQKELRCYWYDGSHYQHEVLAKLKSGTITWNVTATILE